MDFLAMINQLWTAIFTQAGLVAAILFLGILYQTRQLNKSNGEVKAINSQVMNLAVSQVAAMKEVQNMLDKIADIIVRAK